MKYETILRQVRSSKLWEAETEDQCMRIMLKCIAKLDPEWLKQSRKAELIKTERELFLWS